MKRRQFLQLSAAGPTATMVPGISLASSFDYRTEFELTIDSGRLEMIDGTSVFGIYFLEADRAPPSVMRVREGEAIEIRITNLDSRPHGFAITGIPEATLDPIAPNGGQGTARFVAPVGGSYLFHDPVNAPVNRLLGLYGAFIVAPQHGTTPAGSPTPFSRDGQTAEVRALFDALGRTARFPGDPWRPGDEDRDKVWIFCRSIRCCASGWSAVRWSTGRRSRPASCRATSRSTC